MLARIAMSFIFVLFVASSAAAHEVWLAPGRYQAAAGETIALDLMNGQKFVGSPQIYNPSDFARFEVIAGGETRRVEGRLGDHPIAMLTPSVEGLAIIAYQSSISRLTYRRWEEFESFATHKALAGAATRHTARGLPRTGFVEAYARYAKALIGVGAATGADRAVGFETEIVALANPYSEALTEMPVRVLYRGAPRVGVQVELFERFGDGAVAITLHRTDGDGVARLPVRSGGVYLVDAVMLREPSEEAARKTGAVWESLWASLTFAVR